MTTNSFTIQHTKQTFNFISNVNCKSEYFIYIMKMHIMEDVYVGKAETTFNLRLNNHSKETKALTPFLPGNTLAART